MKNMKGNRASQSSQMTWYVFFVLAGSTMIAHGARMIYQGLFYPLSYYPAPVPTTLDFWFDWVILALLGCVVFLYGIVKFFQRSHQRNIPHNSIIYEPSIT